MARRKRGRGNLIGIIGLDGSGKTTLARRLVRELSASGRRVALLHFWPRLGLPSAGPSASDRGRRTPTKLPRGRAFGLFVLAWFLLRVRLPLLLRRYDVVICDRYVPDLAAYLALRGFPHLARRLLRVGARLPPDALFRLRVSPSAQRARKGSELEFSPQVYAPGRRSTTRCWASPGAGRTGRTPWTPTVRRRRSAPRPISSCAASASDAVSREPPTVRVWLRLSLRVPPPTAIEPELEQAHHEERDAEEEDRPEQDLGTDRPSKPFCLLLKGA